MKIWLKRGRKPVCLFFIYGKALSASTGTQAYKLTSVDAKAALVGDAGNGELIYAQNANEKLAPASTTKIMTALLVMDAIAAGQLSLDTPIVVSPTALAGIPSDASHVSPRLKDGEVMNVLTYKIYCITSIYQLFHFIKLSKKR